MANIPFSLLQDTETRKPSKFTLAFLVLFLLFLILSVVFIGLYVKEKVTPYEPVEPTNVPVEPTNVPSDNSKSMCISSGCTTSAADILSKLDQSTNPCDDFYQYSCGGFLKKTFLPDGQQLVDSFSVATDFVQYSMREIFRNEQLMSSYSEGSAVQKAFTYYKSCTNEKNITDLGMQPILDVIEKHGSWKITNNDWSEEFWRLEKVLARVMVDLNTPAFLTLDVRPSFFDTSKMFITISGGRSAYEHEMLDKEQSRLVLKKEYDDDDDDEDSDIYKDYKIFMSKIFKLFGLDSTTTEKEVNRIVEMERGFIKAKTTHSSATSFRDVIKFMTVSELNRLTLFQFDWAMYLREALQDTNKLIVSDQKVMVLFPERIKAIVDWLVEKPKSLLANEIIWNGIRGLINTLPSAFREAQDEYVNSLYGITIPRWRTCNRLTDGAFSLATTLLYINEHLTENARKTAAEMFSEVKGQFIDGLDEQTWMDSTTRAQARLKLKDMGDLIGYPPIVKDPTKLNKVYENIQVDEYHLLQNTINAFKDQFSKKITKLEKSADRSSVASPTPISVNAYYSPQTNGMTILAGILQPPFYKDNRLKALNYGSLGMVVGHEITHGFDMTGSDFDEKGNIRQWWSSYSYKNFLKRSRCLIDEYNKVEIFGYKVNGKKTLSENIADNGGLKYAYRAYQKWRGIHGNEKKLPALPFNNDQLFFIGFAQQWCSKYSNKFAKVLINASVHSLDPVRVRVPLANFPEFSKAFGCTPRADTCTLW